MKTKSLDAQLSLDLAWTSGFENQTQPFRAMSFFSEAMQSLRIGCDQGPRKSIKSVISPAVSSYGLRPLLDPSLPSANVCQKAAQSVRC